MDKNNFKECIIEYVSRQEMIDREIEPGTYHFECKITVNEEGSVDIMRAVLQLHQNGIFKDRK